MERYFGFFADLIAEFPADVEEQAFYYGNTVELYDQICHGNGEFSQFQQAIALHGGPVLDLCCGSGRLTIPAAKLGMAVTGVDLSQDMLDKLSENLRRRNKRLLPRVHLYCQDMAQLDLPEQYGTVMIGATSIRLLQGPFETFFDHIYDQLKEGGCLCFDIENLPRQEHETIVTGDLVPITMADEEGDLSVILMQRRFDYQRGVAEVNMARMRPGKERKVLLTATHYRLFGVDDQSAATACLRSYLKGRGVHSIAYTDDTLPSLNDLAEDVLSIADDGLVLVANQENKLLVNALACRIAQLEDLPIYLLYGGSELNCQAEETVTTIVDGAPEETLTELLGAAEGQPLMKCSPDAQRAALQHIQQRCRERDVLLVADEVATGFGRTGTPFAWQQAEITPDLVCLSKAINNGYLAEERGMFPKETVQSQLLFLVRLTSPFLRSARSAGGGLL